MFDFVPLAGPRWKMAYLELEVQWIRQFLQRYFPQTAAVVVAATSIGRDHQFAGPRKTPLTHFLPPLPDAVGRKFGGGMIDADADPTLVMGHVINAMRNGLAQLLVLEIMDTSWLGIALRSPFLARILEISHQFLLFRVDRHHWLAGFFHPLPLLAYVLKLGIVVRVILAFPRLAVRLQTVTGGIEQAGHRASADGMPLQAKFRGQFPSALASPTQGR